MLEHTLTLPRSPKPHACQKNRETCLEILSKGKAKGDPTNKENKVV